MAQNTKKYGTKMLVDTILKKVFGQFSMMRFFLEQFSNSY